MRIYTLVLAAIVLVVSMSLLAEDKKEINFSGEWKLNQEKSQLGEGRGFRGASKMVITQKGNDLSIERTSQRRNGEESVYTEALTLDGKECTNTIRNNPRTSTANWTDDGKTLTIKSKVVFSRDGNEFEMKSSEIWSLKEDGKVLSIDSTSETPRGERKATYVYDKVVAEKK
jgi:hypothetical protein